MDKVFASVALSVILASAATAAPAGKQGSKSSSNAAAQTYCIQTEATGSRHAKVECRTKEEWSRLGVDVDELLKK
jgi:hypothetical protein